MQKIRSLMNETILVVVLLGFFGIFILPKKNQYFFALSLTIFQIVFTGNIALQSFLNPLQTIELTLFKLTPYPITLTVDPLSAFFILVINLTALTGMLYANGYLALYLDSKTRTEMAWHYFNFLLLHLSMIVVVMVREGIAFLVMWEIMSVSTFFLILFDSAKQEVRNAAMKFVIQMHIALFFLIAAFLVSSLKTGLPMSFDTVGRYFNHFPVMPVFLLFFIGFGIKAGFIPLHSWLPHAHPAAPSHVSGVMSGVLIKIGIYGILRVLTYLHTNLIWIGMIILVVSIFSGIIGVTLAIVQHDYKRLLAYHSIENIGIIGIGIGFGVIGLAIGNMILASLGVAGAILHVLNHSLFKSLLFYSAGSVLQQTHTKNIDHLGGLMKKMPQTAVFFLIGALAISGLPPFNGFISEFLIYSGLFKSLTGNNLLLGFVLIGGIVGLVIIGGLAIFCFTKVFSIIFLGNERSEKTAHASEVRNDMLIPKYLITFFIVIIGLVPFVFLKPIIAVTGMLVPDITALAGMTPTLKGISLTLGILIVLVSGLWYVKLRVRQKQPFQIGPTWGCGYTGANPAIHQYTATSYADYIIDKAQGLVGVKTNFTPLTKDEIFPPPAQFETHSGDVFENSLFLKPVNKLLGFLNRIAVMQTGNIQDYLLYALLFLIFIALLTFLNII